MDPLTREQAEFLIAKISGSSEKGCQLCDCDIPREEVIKIINQCMDIPSTEIFVTDCCKDDRLCITYDMNNVDEFMCFSIDGGDEDNTKGTIWIEKNNVPIIIEYLTKVLEYVNAAEV